jgi:uncharacterized membrane protein YfcA
MDWTLYWFMFPVSIGVATTAMLSGIGGAALFTPIFPIIFPLLGPEYALGSAVAAIGAALLTETFGFSSGFVGYIRKRLIDFKSAIPFIAVGVPVALLGALLAQFTDPTGLKASYGLLMLVLCVILLRHHAPVDHALAAGGDASVGAADARPTRTIEARDGSTYTFKVPRQGNGAVATGLGAFLTGLLSVGIRGRHAAARQTQPGAGPGGGGDLGVRRDHRGGLGVADASFRAHRGRGHPGSAVEPGRLHDPGGDHRRPDRPAPPGEGLPAHGWSTPSARCSPRSASPCSGSPWARFGVEARPRPARPRYLDNADGPASPPPPLTRTRAGFVHSMLSGYRRLVFRTLPEVVPILNSLSLVLAVRCMSAMGS